VRCARCWSLCPAGMGGGGRTFQGQFHRAMAVLVSASPCALAIATPSAVLSGIARAARSGVLIKAVRLSRNWGRLMPWLSTRQAP
jgi:cation transport ATPase